MGKNIGYQVIATFLSIYANDYSHVFADPNLSNIAAIKAYEKAGFKIVSEQKDTNEVWMLWKSNINSTSNHILEELKAREPTFHHPDKFVTSKQNILNMACDEFWEVGASGNVYTREYVIQTLLQRYSNLIYEDI